MSSSSSEHARHNAEREFARAALIRYEIFRDLSLHERNDTLKNTFNDLAQVAKGEFTFWGTKTGVRGDEATASSLARVGHRLLRRMLGPTLMTHFMLEREKHTIARFETHCRECVVDDSARQIEVFLERATAMLPTHKDGHLRLVSKVFFEVSGALMGLTGVLVAFSFVFEDAHTVAVAGVIAGIVGAVTMAGVPYAIAHTTKTEAERIAWYSGSAYLIMSGLLVLPFILCTSIVSALITMSVLVTLCTMLLALYGSVMLGNTYAHQSIRMLTTLFGVVFVSVSAGYLLKMIIVA